MHIPHFLTFAAITFLSCGYALAQPPASAPPVSPAAATAQQLQAVQEIETARQKLLSHSSISANLVETISLYPRSLRGTGRYVQGSLNAHNDGWHLRSELKIRIGGMEGQMLEVCDGNILWQRTVIQPVPGKKPIRNLKSEDPAAKSEPKLEPTIAVNRRNVTQILAAARKRKEIPLNLLQAELALGGIPALLVSFQQAIAFDTLTTEKLNNRDVIVLGGTWNEAQLMRWNNNQKVDLGKISFPAFIPERVELVLDKETGFPQRIVYFKKIPDRKVSAPLLTLEFTDVRVNEPLDKSEFVFVPPDQTPVDDLTQMYLSKLAPSPAGFGGGPPPGNPPPPTDGSKK